MTDLQEHPQRCLLVGIDCDEYDCEHSLNELAMLCESAGGEVISVTSQKRDTPDRATCVGTGKLEEIVEFCESNDIELVVFDVELSPVQMRNIGEVISCAIIDRTMLILDIFAKRAKTADGKIQVELAQLKYRLPHLLGRGNSMSRLGGGIGTRGPGETKLESDRRHIYRRINNLENELKTLSERRDNLRSSRKENDLKTVALVGYTNVGKSTILNKLTNSDVLSKDMLFATLDPTTRSYVLENGQTVLITDTVGFISRLPHQLVSAFKSTIDEAVYADLILNVCDISSPDMESQLLVTRRILSELGCNEDKIVTVYNKCDKLENLKDDKGIVISAKSGFGIDKLIEKIEQMLGSTVLLECLIPFDKMDIIAKIRKRGMVIYEDYLENGVKIRANVDKKDLYFVEKFVI